MCEDKDDLCDCETCEKKDICGDLVEHLHVFPLINSDNPKHVRDVISAVVDIAAEEKLTQMDFTAIIMGLVSFFAKKSKMKVGEVVKGLVVIAQNLPEGSKIKDLVKTIGYDEKWIKVIKNSKNAAEVLEKLGLKLSEEQGESSYPPFPDPPKGVPMFWGRELYVDTEKK